MIKADNITKTFHSTKAVDAVSFEIQPGSVVGLLGPNGAGKSTTMRLLTGYLTADSGTISIDGVNIEEDPHTIQQKIGYLPENNPLYYEMLVSEALEFAAKLSRLDTSRRKEAFDFAVHSVGIEQYYYRPIHELSKGYKQRVGLAMALLHQPDILILDEPSEGLDPTQRSEIRTLITELAKDRTIILSTHVMQEVAAVCSRILIINRGKLVADGTPEELSRMAKSERALVVTIEGDNVATSLEKVHGVLHIEITKSEDKKNSLLVGLDAETMIQPEIARLSRENNWVIWEMHDQEHDLETIFQKITTENYE